MELVEYIFYCFLAVVILFFMIAFGIQFLIHNHENHCVEIDRKVVEVNRLRR